MAARDADKYRENALKHLNKKEMLMKAYLEKVNKNA